MAKNRPLACDSWPRISLSFPGDCLPCFRSSLGEWFLWFGNPMKTQKGRCKCLNCKEDFLPDYRNRRRQRFCSKADCRKGNMAYDVVKKMPN